ncbi:MAG: hypothetical protein J6328_01590 [Bacilli bacterium]|nr:hypothetical protein [Bacilli bacterium]
MLLSYYDSFWDDDYVDDRYDVESVFSPEGIEGLSIAPLDGESPGVLGEPHEAVSALSNSSYFSWCHNNSNLYFQSSLIDTASSMFGWPISGDASNPFALTLYQETALINYNNVFRGGLNSGCVVARLLENGGRNEETLYFIEGYIEKGDPVLLNMVFNPGTSDEWRHSVVAYDVNHRADCISEIFVHPGWKTTDGSMPLTHVSLSQLSGVPYSVEGSSKAASDAFPGCVVESAIALERLSPQGVCDNYVSASGEVCLPQSMVKIHNFRNTSPNFRDYAPVFRWDCLVIDDWECMNGMYWKCAISDFEGNTIVESIPPSNQICEGFFALESEAWEALLRGGNSYSVAVSLITADGCDIVSSIRCSIEKPLTYSGAYSFAVEDLSFSSNSFGTDIHSVGGSLFTTKRQNCEKNGDSILFKGKKGIISRSRLTFEFTEPVLRIDLFAKASSLSMGDVKAYYSKSIGDDLELFTGTFSYSASSYDWITFEFQTAIKRFVIEVVIYPVSLPSNSPFQPGFAIKRFALWHRLPMSGYEPLYEPDRWNNNATIEANCYSYSLNAQLLQDGTYFPCYLGELYGHIATYFDDWNLDSTIRLDFAAAYGISSESPLLRQFIKSIGRFDVCPGGMYKIAGCYRNGDYHWFRQDSTGYWSMKDGVNGEVKDTDYGGKPILDPFICDRGGYVNFLGYYAIRPFGRLCDEI